MMAKAVCKSYGRWKTLSANDVVPRPTHSPITKIRFDNGIIRHNQRRLASGADAGTDRDPRPASRPIAGLRQRPVHSR
jgi:hypothetical protein